MEEGGGVSISQLEFDSSSGKIERSCGSAANRKVLEQVAGATPCQNAVEIQH